MISSAPPCTVPGGLLGFVSPPDGRYSGSDDLPDTLKFSPSSSKPQRPSYQAIARALMAETLPAYRRPEAQLNIANELQKPYWTADEFAPISLGLNPALATPRAFSRHLGDEVALECLRRSALFLRAQIVGDLPRFPRPKQAIEWAKTKRLSLPRELAKRVRSISGSSVNLR